MLDRKLRALRADRAQLYDKGIDPLGSHCREGGLLRGIRLDQDRLDPDADATRVSAELRSEGRGEGIGLVGENGDTVYGWKQLANELEPLARNLDDRPR